MDNKDTKSIVAGVESEGAFSSDISSAKEHASAVVHAPGQNEEFKADTHNVSKNSSEEASTTNLDNNSSEEQVASLLGGPEYISHSTGTVRVMDNKDTKSVGGGVQSEGGFSSDIFSVKGHTSAVVHAPGQNEEFKTDAHNVSWSSSEERCTTNLDNSSSEEQVSSSVVASEYSSHSSESVPVMDNKDMKSSIDSVESEGTFSSHISSLKGHTFAFVHVPGQNEKFKADTHNVNRSSSEEGSTINLDNRSSEEEVASSVVAPEYTSRSTGTIPVMDNKDMKSIVSGVQSEGAFSSDISSMKGHSSAVVQAPGQNEELKADTHNLNRSSSEEGSTTNLGSSSSKEEVAFSDVAPEYTSHGGGTVPVMVNKDTKNIIGGVESEGAFSAHISSLKGHTSAVVHALGQNEEFKADTHNVSSSSSEEWSSSSSCSSSSEEVVALWTVSSSEREFLWDDYDNWPRDPSGAETGNEKESFRLVRRIHPSELRILRKMSEGGEAKIFLALFEHKLVVVKRYKDRHVNVANLQRQMEMVMKACEGTSEAGLCKVIGVSRDEKGKALLVMQLMRGDLRNLINSKKLLLHSCICDIMRGIARGLKTLHACGLTHKDVKSSNILVNTQESEPIPIPPTGLEKLSWQMPPSDYVKDHWDLPLHLPPFDDLGREISYCTCTYVKAYIGDYENVNGVMGTGFWRPPEVLKALRDGSPQDLELAYTPAGDVYGFGMVLYELLTGKYPFQGHHLSDYDLVISGHRPDIPDDVNPEMRDLLLRCWHQDPHQRPSWTEIEKCF
ncbi:hypothetical protein BDL97_04G011400 [Sphagnum fallax]|nr:hypothetical protein BDL97_04G011400 [Sphagnum fallax]